MDIGTRLREIRELHDMTQEDTAKAFNISHQALSNYERGLRVPNKDFLIQFAEYFNHDKYELINIFFGVSIEEAREHYGGKTQYEFLSASEIDELPETELDKIRDYARLIYNAYRRSLE